MDRLLFGFKLVHIPADKHHGPDGLSHREPVKGKEEDDDPEEWIDHALSLGIWVLTWLDTPQPTQIFTPDQAPSGNPSASDDPADFPTSEKALKTEDNLARVKQYLHSFQLPADLDDKSTAGLL